MPTLKAIAKGNDRGGRGQFSDFHLIWHIENSSCITCESPGKYRYVNSGGSREPEVGVLKTYKPLDTSGNGGISSFEIILTSAGKYLATCS